LNLSKINLGEEAEEDIRNSVNAGKIATAHENKINFNGWIGEGYTLIDPQTGAGAYMISGGGNGGLLTLQGLAVGLLQALALFFVATPILAAIIGVAVLLMGVILVLTEPSRNQPDFQGARFLGLIGGFILTWIIGEFVLISIPLLFLLGFVFLMLTVIRLLIIEMLTLVMRGSLLKMQVKSGLYEKLRR
jgi:hypothetical protein